MIAALTLAAIIAATDAAAGLSVQQDSATALIADARGWLLSGEPLPKDMALRLQRLDPAARITVLVFLRRSGLMTGPGWSAEQILSPPDVPETAE
ncbi:hypothetical protein [Paracoccus sp. PAR01]|uniref:hypothetical protein n=1 Tax=Paracoccus sp. PAR01 TaxID=2769282 RepID=UPI001784EE29|nr:hypothetical protein [Paracoccus sp. PAR01]MBD9526600.1 hypothetical protein [Paracoccus sp. PAR01]